MTIVTLRNDYSTSLMWSLKSASKEILLADSKHPFLEVVWTHTVKEHLGSLPARKHSLLRNMGGE